jgi:hypothetical protein
MQPYKRSLSSGQPGETWLDQCGLTATTVTLNGDTYLLPASTGPAPASDNQ